MESDDNDVYRLKDLIIEGCKGIIFESGIIDVVLSIGGCCLFLFYDYFKELDPILFGVDGITVITYLIRMVKRKK